MERRLPVLAALLLSACASNDEVTDPTAITMTEAVDDFVAVSELEAVPAVRTLEQLHHKVISSQYILIFDNRRKWLAKYSRPCKKLYQSDVTPDIRYERNTVRARFDTFRGCKVQEIYQIGDGMADELLNLGKAPGEQ